ncbi:hypothetical protein [uncultured Alistipes sp.]|uniref:hypothetical protein n=1 Tax=uncultured Alistipes sp. TaxID=538949 RepID=UPI00272B0D0A|nr:hypothetical protein [uncultured Alistipes sp.]
MEQGRVELFHFAVSVLINPKIQRKDKKIFGKKHNFVEKSEGFSRRRPPAPFPPRIRAAGTALSGDAAAEKQCAHDQFEGTVHNERQAGKMPAAPIRTPARRKSAAVSGTLRDDGRPHNV